MHAMACLTNSGKHILEFLRTIGEKCYTIVMRECNPLFPHYIDDERVRSLGK